MGKKINLTKEWEFVGAVGSSRLPKWLREKYPHTSDGFEYEPEQGMHCDVPDKHPIYKGKTFKYKFTPRGVYRKLRRGQKKY